MKAKTFLMVVAVLLLVKTAFGQGCEQILFGGVFNTFNQQGSSYTSEYWHNAWCNGVIEASSGSSSGGASLNFGVGKIGLGFGVSDAQEFQKIYKQTFCSTSTGSSTNIANNTSVQKVASPDILKAYTDCKAIEAKGLKVDFSVRPEDNKVFVISVTYGGALGSPKVKKIAFLPNVITNQSGSLVEGVLLKKNQSYALTAERTTDVPMTVVIDTDVGTFFRNMPRFIPPPTDQELIMASLPRGTILGWYSQTIPKGWVICDGSNGTPRLSERFPMGTNDSTKLGTEGGKSVFESTIRSTTPSEGAKNTNVKQENNQPLTVYGTDHKHDVQIKVDTVPPFARIIFIMKI